MASRFRRRIANFDFLVIILRPYSFPNLLKESLQIWIGIGGLNDHEMTPLDVAVEGLVLAVEGEYEEIAKLLRAAANFQAKSPV